MKKYALLALLFFAFSVSAQISTPEKKKFNVGIYFGNNIRIVKPFVSADISYKFLTARLMTNVYYNAAGLNAEVVQLSKVFYNLYWNVGFNYGFGEDKNRYDRLPEDPDLISKYSVIQGTTGLRTYFKNHFYTFMLAGVSRTVFVTPGRANEEEYLPYIEIGLGYNIWKTYPKLKPEETEE